MLESPRVHTAFAQNPGGSTQDRGDCFRDPLLVPYSHRNKLAGPDLKSGCGLCRLWPTGWKHQHLKERSQNGDAKFRRIS